MRFRGDFLNFTIFDAHCDTLTKLTDFNGNIRQNTYHIDLERARKYTDGYIQVFAAFVDKKIWTHSPFERAVAQIDKYHKELELNRDIAMHCTSVREIENTLGAKKIATILAVEGGEAIEGSLEKLQCLYDMGVRIMTLTWNYDNEISGGIGKNTSGLTELGRTVVNEMNNLGMLIDVSHLSAKGFWDVAGLSKKPIVATHSNVKRLCSHQRNLNDEQIKRIIEMNGFIGVNFYPLFVKGERCTIDDIVDHIEYYLALGGENNIGFGSDFDGIDTMPDGVRGVEDIEKIIDCMIRRGIGENTIRKIASQNLFRVIKEVL